MKRMRIAFTALFLLAALLLPALSAAASVPSVNTGDLVYDYAGLFTDREAEELRQALRDASSRHNMDFVILTIEDNLGYSPRSYADAFYESNPFRYDGTLLYIDMVERDVYLLTSGRGEDKFSNADINRVLDAVAGDLGRGNSRQAGLTYIKEVEKVLSSGGLSPWMAVGCSFLIAGIVGVLLIVLHGRSMAPKPGLHAYFDENGMRMKRQEDRFIHTHTTRIPLPRDNGSSGGGGGGGGHHTTSSGRSFGGGGRKF